MVWLALLVVPCAAINYGPQNCVELSKTAAGTCMIKTNCDNVDTSKFDFAFVCVTQDGGKESQVKHEFGAGGFDSDEDYDTEVKCDECLTEARPLAVHSLVANTAPDSSTPAVVTASSAPPAAAAFYGPGGCIATYRSQQGTCVVQTRCATQSTKDYTYGLTCVDAKGASAKHLFGKNSFDAEESFDTLVECELCLGYDGAPKVAASNATNTTGNATADPSIASDVKTLQSEVKALQVAVKEIKDKLDTEPATVTTTAAAADDGEATDGDSQEATGFLHKFHHHYTKAKKHHRHARRQREEDFDDDEAAVDDDDLDEDSLA